MNYKILLALLNSRFSIFLFLQASRLRVLFIKLDFIIDGSDVESSKTYFDQSWSNSFLRHIRWMMFSRFLLIFNNILRKFQKTIVFIFHQKLNCTKNNLAMNFCSLFIIFFCFKMCVLQIYLHNDKCAEKYLPTFSLDFEWTIVVSAICFSRND